MTAQDGMFTELETRFAALMGEHTRLDAEAEANIVRWRYSVDSAFELRADFYRRFNEKPGTLTDDEPVSAYIYHAYGLDARDDFIYEAIFQSEADPRLCRYYHYGDDVIEMVEYGVELYQGRYHLRTVGRLYRDAHGRPLHYAECSRRDAAQTVVMREVYHYGERGELRRIAVTNAWGTGSEHRYEYEGDTLRRIVAVSSDAPQPFVLFEAPRAGETDEQVSEAARATLRVEVLHQLSQIDLETRQEMRWCSLEVFFDAVADEHMLLTLVPEVVRQEWERMTLERSYRAFKWESSGDQRLVQVTFSPPPEYHRFVQRARLDEKWDDIRMLVYTVAYALNHEDWDGLLNVTDDFIVFGNDYLTEDPHDEIRASVPKDKLRILQAKGLIE